VFAISFASVVAAMMPGDDAASSFNSAPRQSTMQKYSAWMSRLPDQVRISELSLPGTHDSCALHDGLSFGFAKCQSWQLSGQLKAGIRFLDIRCRHVGNRFQIYHGVIDQKMTFLEVQDTCRKFLLDHPSECIVMSVKEESTAQNSTRSFKETFQNEITSDAKLWHVDTAIPKLESVRGRIVLIDRVGKLGGIPWSTIMKQDQYTVSPNVKEKLVREHFGKTMKDDGRRWFVNFCSGTVPSSLLTPRKYALELNQSVLEFVDRHSGDGVFRLGTVVMDFPSEQLVEQIVESNFLNENH